MARVLLIEDEPRTSSFLSRALSADGFGVDRTPDGAQGLELARRGDYDLVVLDLMLPTLDGVSVLRGIMKSRPEQPVLVVSAISDVESKVKCLELGACDYIPKPFELAEFLVRLRKGLHRRGPTVADWIVRVGRATLDSRRRVVDVGEGPISLSAREYLVVQHLMRRAGEVCTREELLGDVWGYSFDPGTNVVDVYIARLRAKLGSEVIETVRSVGYSFKAP
jgi:DNA-binding response OmpR family regulator